MKNIIIFLFTLSSIFTFGQYGKTELKRTTKPKANPIYNAELKTSIQGGVDVEILDFEKNYWLIQYDTIIGWVRVTDLYKTRAMIEKMNEYNAEQEKLKNLSKAEKIKDLWGEEYVERLLNGRVWIGMSKAMLIESKGYPDDKNSTRSQGGLHEQWIYGKSITNRTYIYLDNGVVTTIQN